MREVFAAVAAWLSESRPCAAATLISTDRPGLAAVGTTIAVDSRGAVVGSIGGGCYEADAIEACLQTMQDGISRTIDVSLQDEFLGGTGCGARLRIATWLPPKAFLSDARTAADGREALLVALPTTSPFVLEIAAREPLVVIGATSLAAEICAIAWRADFRVTVIDPRPAFATRERLSLADRIICDWPDAVLPELLQTAPPVIVLTHDPKIDIPALRCALQSDAPYIGLLGSRRAQVLRREALRHDGFDEDDFRRVHGPAGLDLGASTSAEVAIAILAELIAIRNGRSGGSLCTAAGAIHGTLVSRSPS